MMDDMQQYLNMIEETEGNTTQSIIGISNIFRGWILKNFKNMQDIRLKKITALNMIIKLLSCKALFWRSKNFFSPLNVS